MSWIATRRAAASTALVVTILLTVSAFDAQASTIVYTDRAAFNAAVGATTLLTFDPVVCAQLPDFPPIYCKADYGLMTVVYDSVFIPGELAPPYIRYGLGPYQVGTVLTKPVTAIGFDIIPLEPVIQFTLFLSPHDSGFFTFSAPSFLGFVSTDSVFSEFSIDNFHCSHPPLGSHEPCNLAIDNMALQMAEPATLSLLVPGVLILWSTAGFFTVRKQ